MSGYRCAQSKCLETHCLFQIECLIRYRCRKPLSYINIDNNIILFSYAYVPAHRAVHTMSRNVPVT